MSAWKEGTEVTISAKGTVNSNGLLEIGCRAFSEADIKQFTTIVETVEPAVKYQAGDIYALTGGHREVVPRVRQEDGTWHRLGGSQAASSDADVDGLVSRHHARFIIKHGKVVL